MYRTVGSVIVDATNTVSSVREELERLSPGTGDILDRCGDYLRRILISSPADSIDDLREMFLLAYGGFWEGNERARKRQILSCLSGKVATYPVVAPLIDVSVKDIEYVAAGNENEVTHCRFFNITFPNRMSTKEIRFSASWVSDRVDQRCLRPVKAETSPTK